MPCLRRGRWTFVEGWTFVEVYGMSDILKETSRAASNWAGIVSAPKKWPKRGLPTERAENGKSLYFLRYFTTLRCF